MFHVCIHLKLYCYWQGLFLSSLLDCDSFEVRNDKIFYSFYPLLSRMLPDYHWWWVCVYECIGEWMNTKMRFLIFFLSIFLHGSCWSWVAGLVVRHWLCSCSEFSEPVLHPVLCISKTRDGTMASELKEAWPACSEPLRDCLIQRYSFVPQRSEGFHSQDCKVRNCPPIPSGWWFTCYARTKSLQGPDWRLQSAALLSVDIVWLGLESHSGGDSSAQCAARPWLSFCAQVPEGI